MRMPLQVLAALVACFTAQAYAQSDNEKYIGIGARLGPEYDGADSSRVDVIPNLRLYGEHFFARTTQGILEGGWRTKPFGSIVFGAQLAYEEGRTATDSDYLEQHHFGHLGASGSLGLHAEGDWMIGPMPLNALLRYRHDIDSDNGTQTDLRLTAGILNQHGFRASIFGQVTLGDSKSMQRYFGISPQQSVATKLPAYGASSGARSIEVGVVGDIDISQHWIGLWGITARQLQGDAKNSPLTLDKTGWHANIGVAYRF